MFFGTPQWAVPSLEALLAAGIEVAVVVTNPDRPAGRGMKAHAPPVKQFALDRGLEVLQPARARDPEFHEQIAHLEPDVAAVVAYGKILPPELLAFPRCGFVNLHFSLLPEYRGAAPVQRAIMDGKDMTGISIMVLTEGMDEGPVLATAEEAIRSDDTGGSLGARLAHTGAPLLAATLERYVAGEIKPQEQDHARATYAPKVTDDDAHVDWHRSQRAIIDLARACNPVPGAWTTLRARRVKLWRLRAASTADLAPGEVAYARDLLVGTSDGDLVVEEAQLEGKRRMAGADLGRGLRLDAGERFA